MLDLSHIHVYCWDARPYPAFPYNTDLWGDGANWRFGHWLNGRFAAAPLAETVKRILDDYNFSDHEAGALYGTVDGYVVERVMSPRDAIQPLELAYFFDSLEFGGRILFRHRGAEPPVLTLTEQDLVEARASDTLLTLTRGQETELPASAKIRRDFGAALARAGRTDGAITEFTAVARLDPGAPAAHVLLGSALAQAGRWAEAVQSFQNGLRVAPADPELASATARFMCSSGSTGATRRPF